MATNHIKTLDPVQGLVDYVLDIKPYHTKIIEVLIEYAYTDPVNTTFSEELFVHVNSGTPMIGGFDVQYWDVGGFDENLGTLVQLYKSP